MKSLEGWGRISLGTIRCVREVMRCKSVTVAAEYLGVTQPAVSQHISRFETITGITILVRQGNAITIESNAILEHIEDIMEAERLLIAFSQHNSPKKIRLGICCEVAAFISMFSNVFSEFLKKFNVVVEDATSLFDLYLKGALDVVLRPVHHHEKSQDLSFDIPLIWVSGTDYERSESNILPVVMESDGSPIRYFCELSLRKDNIPYSVVATVADYTTRMKIVSDGIACAVVPKFLLSVKSPYKLKKIDGIGNSTIKYAIFYNVKKVSFKEVYKLFEGIDMYIKK